MSCRSVRIYGVKPRCVCRARVSGDPVLKELYEDMAAEFAHDTAGEQNLDSLKNSELESCETPELVPKA